jgi:hypothetical protein
MPELTRLNPIEVSVAARQVAALAVGLAAEKLGLKGSMVKWFTYPTPAAPLEDPEGEDAIWLRLTDPVNPIELAYSAAHQLRYRQTHDEDDAASWAANCVRGIMQV